MRKVKLTKQEVEIILNSFKAPEWMMANIEAGGSFIQANYDLEVKIDNGEYVAIIG